MTVRVIAVDMDGTFLRSDMTYDRERFVRLRERMRAADIRFVVASGNQYWQLASFFDGGLVDAFVSENGHFVYEDGERLYSAEQSPDAVRSMIRLLEDGGWPYLVSGPEGALMRSDVSAEGWSWASQYFHRLTRVADPREHADEVVRASFLAHDPVAAAESVGQALGGSMDAVASGPEDVDLNVPGNNKAVGLGHVLERWGVDAADVVAFGDNHNDLEMLGVAGLSIAMGNARPRVQEAADRLAPSHDEDGVLVVLEELLS
ncbi:Cof-type HAD-IIB family hydrolase [Nigerium massiliense]|uniref:Cof-type HAD-IIB family hydrolase n=1 Tax=Nigerium massiliense TaxID=1522317 RepID=UPI00058AC000|nr:HAD family hydrolase [Nigerium massiliense]